MEKRPPTQPPDEGSEEWERQVESEQADFDHQQALLEHVTVKERRKMRARRTESQSIWFGLGMFGIIGWSIAMPTLLGIVLGLWLDRRYPGEFSWTIALLFAGVTVGVLNAWYWIGREREMIERGRRNDNHR
jgi:ATP synthase protein I